MLSPLTRLSIATVTTLAVVLGGCQRAEVGPPPPVGFQLQIAIEKPPADAVIRPGEPVICEGFVESSADGFSADYVYVELRAGR